MVSLKTDYWKKEDINEVKEQHTRIYWYFAIFSSANLAYALWNESYILLLNTLPLITSLLALTTYNRWKKEK